ncbi:MAG: glycoside hydrolase family 3 C-terminal domain-containing protein [Bacilli bacterium]|nr:glycoside hydrolase family 3 C-terminal domain-containing protein [Bacilli bacterium]
MENKLFKRKLMSKAIISGVFGLLTLSSAVAISMVNENVIKPNEGFITNALCEVETGGSKNKLGERLAVEIEQEGIVLAKNDDDCLPLAKSQDKVNVFGYDAIQWIISNSGSGSAEAGSSQKTWGILEALEDKGISYNKDIINYYKNWATPRDRGVKSYSSSYDVVYRLTNPSLSNNSDYATLYNQAKADTDTAIVVIGRWGGEHLDPPHEQINNYKSSKTKNTERGYLEITEEEEELLTAVGRDYEHVVVVINSTNVMQMDFMTEIEGLDSCLIVGPTGTVGAKAIPQVLYGDVNPSGRTADTWPMDHRYNVAYYTTGYWPDQTGTYYTNVPSGANLANKIDTANFADYYEGIYVGYKWFETADAEGFWDNNTYNGYNNVVAYPFGYGLSYTDFSWSVVSASPNTGASITENQDVTLQVKVTNNGTVAGRDVVEAYLTAEYHKGGIEKSAVKLVAFQKTKTLMPGESEIVTLTAKTRDFMQFDCYDANKNDHAGYELDQGEYQIRFMSDAHHDKEGCTPVKYQVPTTINVDRDPETGNEVKPLFTGEDAIDGVSCDGKTINEGVTFLTREEFAPLMTSINPCRPWNKGLETCDDSSKPTAYSTNMANAWDNATTDVFGNPTPTDPVTFGKKNGLTVLDSNRQLTELGITLAEDYDAEEWDDVLDQVTWDEVGKIAAGQSYSRPGIASVGLRTNNNDYRDTEGASQVGGSLDGGRRTTAYPTPSVQAQCWNEDISYSFGFSEAKDMSLTGNDYLYGPASNIHRNPYGGRHAEYHSEDGFLAGKCLANVTKGLSDGGKNGFIKHFAMNDTEYHRVGLFLWTTEQAMRELYLRPFEESVKHGEATALMTSFNRIGAIWTGGSQALIQGVLRNEWGFNGMTITDYTENGTLQDANQMVRSGGNYILASSNYSHPSLSKATPRFQWRMRESAKQVIYGNLRTQYCNYRYNTEGSNKVVINNSKAPWIWWKPALYSIEGTIITMFAIGFILPLIPSNQEFREELLSRLKKKKEN